MRNEGVSIPRSNRRSLKLPDETNNAHATVHPKKEPPSFAGKHTNEANPAAGRMCSHLLVIWKSIRFLSSGDQIHPKFCGWIINQLQKADSKKTSMTYLPPIPTPITEYDTIIQMFKVSRELAKQSNMSYTHITLDAGAAIKAFHVIWNRPSFWSDIIIHLGDFHAMMAFFAVIGRIISNSGFEEVLFQAGHCNSGSINGVITGKHYNRCWLVHESFSEALERLFLIRFLTTIPDTVVTFAQSSSSSAMIQEILADENASSYIQSYETYKKRCLKGDFGKTPQFWMMYMNLIDRQRKLHYAIKNNDFSLRLLVWKESLPLCFATNRVHYARYGTYYLKSIECLESTHPGAKEEIEKVGLSVRRNTLGIGQAVDLAGEQTYMRNAKTAGMQRKFVKLCNITIQLYNTKTS